jgi:quinol-cytochrome oxidoreductase complex cytochrome b subunit
MRKPCLRVLIMLVVQYALGVFLNLYVNIPASDSDAGFAHEISSAPLSLTLHALLGLALIAAAIAAVVRSGRGSSPCWRRRA